MLHGDAGATRPDLIPHRPKGRPTSDAELLHAVPPPQHMTEGEAAELLRRLEPGDLPAVLAQAARALSLRWGVPGFEVANRNAALLICAGATALLYGGPALVAGRDVAGAAR